MANPNPSTKKIMAVPASANGINEYANSMFRFERMHKNWIDRCTRYLTTIFGDHIKGKTVVDYAFGRGNWSVAFLQAGAAKVIAIDASQSNAERFRDYCNEHRLTGIEVLCANILDAPIDRQADILWLYGILSSIPDQKIFLQKVLKMVPKEDALVLGYGYDAGSIREWLVSRCREALCYASEAEFRYDSLKFTPASRLRARDDLTAPRANWHTAKGMAEAFSPFGFYPVKQVDDFRIVDMGYSAAEFAPVHLLFSRNGKETIPLAEPAHLHADDIKILDAMWQALVKTLDKSRQRDLAISAFNTHFSHLGTKGEVESSLINLYLLLLYGLHTMEVDVKTLPPLAAAAFELGNAALAGGQRSGIAGIGHSCIVDHLLRNTVRI
jgi:hypothetical protein